MSPILGVGGKIEQSGIAGVASVAQDQRLSCAKHSWLQPPPQWVQDGRKLRMSVSHVCGSSGIAYLRKRKNDKQGEEEGGKCEKQSFGQPSSLVQSSRAYSKPEDCLTGIQVSSVCFKTFKYFHQWNLKSKWVSSDYLSTTDAFPEEKSMLESSPTFHSHPTTTVGVLGGHETV